MKVKISMLNFHQNQNMDRRVEIQVGHNREKKKQDVTPTNHFPLSSQCETQSRQESLEQLV